ncbi:glycerophosphodiester phosphodiesterase [Altererythrobacter confluentis]|uniref:Glycerophosphodiester phosphodiesterase n=1 Tax=Allopontixanthobacter confluentis TaxID=1849021 RepID=A0A6L7GHL8_9SPHN|nr:glycerophosphodiester phosphodiesterase family protein [Allopontixanthobacter confluentis]MXP15015.1 glycerophosphodiester phosphodiesterase [Allopontixanthobacter confluentis]
MRSLLLALIDQWRAPPPAGSQAGSQPNRRTGWLGQWTYAHRGLHSADVPENSPAAFARAIDAGLGIECDVQRSADSRAMVFHDWDLDRLTPHTGPVAALKAEEIERISLPGDGGTIPTLERFLEQVGGRVPVLIEIKSRKDRRILPICLAVHRALDGYRGQCAVMSFDPRVSQWFARHSGHVVRGLVVTEEGTKNLAGRLRRHFALWIARPEFLAYDIRDLPSRFAAAQRRRGLPVLSWTVRTAEHLQTVSRYADAAIAEGEAAQARKSALAGSPQA